MSFNIALSGLTSTNTQLGTISNNIANAATTGFKESRTEFSSIYNQNKGGGVEVAGSSQNFDKNGAISTTGRKLDLAISGQGFFITQNEQGIREYTRSGAFFTDENRALVNQSGAVLQGYPVDQNGNLQTGVVADITVQNAALAASATDNLAIGANLDARSLQPSVGVFDPNDINSYNNSNTTEVYDSLGSPHTITEYFIKTANVNEWQIITIVDGDVAKQDTTTIQFDASGNLISVPSTMPINQPVSTGAAPLAITFDFANLSQYGSDFAVSRNDPNGYTSGDLTGIRIEDDGSIFAQYSNGQSLLQGQILLADFPSTQGLQEVNNTAWVQTAKSGVPIVGAPSVGILGSISAGTLEMSNVDITNEMINLMEAQKNYQANSKTIATMNELNQTLMNSV